MYRPEYYRILENENGSSTKERAELIIAKHRNGAFKTINLAYVSKYTKFVNPDCLDENFNNHFCDRTVIHFRKMNNLQINIMEEIELKQQTLAYHSEHTTGNLATYTS